MSLHFFVRIGVFSDIGRFRSVDGTRYPRMARVVCRTRRGLEIGQVLTEAECSPDEGAAETDGVILREMTVQDDLLHARLQNRKQHALEACCELLRQRGLDAVLVDVEHLFDGRSLYFYFLGNVTDEINQITAELAETYEAKAQFRQFAETLTEGCGPGCGTDAAEGGGLCGTEHGCSSCAVAVACSANSR